MLAETVNIPMLVFGAVIWWGIFKIAIHIYKRVVKHEPKS